MNNPKRTIQKERKEEEYINPMYEECQIAEEGEYEAIIQNIEEVRGDNTEDTFIEMTIFIKELKMEHKIKYLKAKMLTPNLALYRFRKYYNRFPEVDMEITAIVGDKSIYIKTR